MRKLREVVTSREAREREHPPLPANEIHAHGVGRQWVGDAICEITIEMVAIQVKRAAETHSEDLNERGFHVLLCMQEKYGLSSSRIIELQKELGLW